MKKKVAIITNVPSPYRVDFFYYLQTTYDEFEFSVIYYCNDSLAREWNTDKNKIINSYFVPSKTIRIKKRFDDHYISFPVGVGKTLSKLAPDVVVAMEYSPAILQAMRWCRKKKVRYISWTDGTINSEKNIGKLQRMSRKYIFKHADAFIASSHASRENQLAYGADKDKCHISMLTVDVEKYIIDSKTEYNDTLLYVGSLIERKGVDLLIEALAKSNSRPKLVIVGNGQEKDKLIKLATKLGVLDRIEFKGFLEGEALRNCYADAGAFILPTREDCFGLVLIEAMCAKLPIIVSKYSDGAAETVTDGVNGFIVDPYDVKEMAKAIDKVFEKTEKMVKMGQESFSRVDRFRFSEVSKGYLAAIKSVI